MVLSRLPDKVLKDRLERQDRPENCETAKPTRANPGIWRKLRGPTQKRYLQLYKMQLALVKGIIPVTRFGFRGRQEHHQLKFGDFKIVSTSAGKYVEWSVERLRKISANERKFSPKTWATNHEERYRLCCLKNTSLTDQVLCV